MKELIGSALLIASLLGAGNIVAREVHAVIKREAIKKVSQGLPSLTALTKTLRSPRPKK